MQAAWSKSVTRLPISSGGWDQWERIDLGVCSLCVPPGDIEVEAVGPTGVRIRMPSWQIDIPDLLLGRRLSADAQAGGQLRLLSRNGEWRPVSFRSFRRRAHFATSADFRWSMSGDQVWELEQLLYFKAIHAQGMQGETQFVGHQHAEIVITSSSKGDAASIWASPRNDRDSVVFQVHIRDRDAFAWGIFAAYSIRFPDRPFPAEGAALERHIQSLVESYRSKRNSMSQPAQP